MIPYKNILKIIFIILLMNIILDTCIICNNLLVPIIDLGKQPLANNLLSSKKDTISYPLVLTRCETCNHIQLDYSIDKNILFNNYNYESGISNTGLKYFEDFAEKYNNLIPILNRKKNVLDIACNDGSQLDAFLRKGWNTFGIDPAANIVENTIKKGHYVECKFWDDTVSNTIKNTKFDLIIAQNVFAHVKDPINFLKLCTQIMSDDTYLVIQTSQANMIFNNEFDTIYHEHISFFTIKSMIKAVELVGCYLLNVYKVDIHGTSYIFEIKKGNRYNKLPLLEYEINNDLYEKYTYINYSISIKYIKNTVLDILNEYYNNGYNIIGFGAAAKGNVFLNYIFDSTPNILCPKYIIDESKLKIKKYTPGTLILIEDISILQSYKKQNVLIIILAWNFSNEIINKIQEYITNIDITCTCIQFFPKIKTTILK